MESEKSPLLGKRSEDEPKSFDVINNDKTITSTMYKEQFIDWSRENQLSQFKNRVKKFYPPHEIRFLPDLNRDFQFSAINTQRGSIW